MNSDSQYLDYLTVDSIQWAKGYVRPRMPAEEKRAKHRVHQRNFVLRQRERIEQLERELRCHKLQLMRLQAAQEAAALASENESLLQKLSSDSRPTSVENLRGMWDLFPHASGSLSEIPTTSSPEVASVSVDEDDSFIFELMALLPEIKAEYVTLTDSCSAPPCKVQVPTPLAWSPTTPCDLISFSW